MSTADDISRIQVCGLVSQASEGYAEGLNEPSTRRRGRFVCRRPRNDKYAFSTYAHLYGDDPTADVSSETFKNDGEHPV